MPDRPKIVPLGHQEWSASAALGNAAERVVGEGTHVLVLWVDAGGHLNYSQSGMTREELAWIAARLLRVAASEEGEI